LAAECGHTFQTSKQPWDRTDLHLLTSLAVGHLDDAWNLPPDNNHQYVTEHLEEDFFSSSYREDPSTIWDEFFDDKLNCQYSNENSRTYQNLVAASLKRLVVYHAIANSDQISDDEQQQFFLTIHFITSSDHFLRHLVTLFDCDLSNTNYQPINANDQSEMRKNIINLIKKWITYHGLFIGRRTLKSIERFLIRINNDPKHTSLKKWIEAILQSLPSLTYGAKKGNSSTPENPEIKNPLIMFKPSLNILGPEPLEVARQITLIYQEKFATIHSLEFIIALSNRKPTIKTPTLSDFFLFSQSITSLFAETFVNTEPKEQQNAYARIIEIIKCLFDLLNLDAVACLTQLMLRPDICTIGRATEQQKQLLLDLWKKTGENDKNEPKPTEYETIIDKNFNEWKSGIPNMSAELKRADKKTRHLPDFVNGLINWEKVRNLSQRCIVLYRFQNQFYNFYTIPQIRKIILKGPTMSGKDIEDKIEEQARILKEKDDE